MYQYLRIAPDAMYACRELFQHPGASLAHAANGPVTVEAILQSAVQ